MSRISPAGRVYGWKKQSPDRRDWQYKGVKPHELDVVLPSFADLRPSPNMPALYDQSRLGSCTANACAGNLQFIQPVELANVPSRLFIYYNERAIEHTTGSDSGGQLRDVVKAVANKGACDETLWPYDITKFTQKPTAPCYAKAKLDLFKTYLALQDITDMKSCLAAGFPFIFGFTVYESFESPTVASTGIVPMPGVNEQVLGGHAVMAVGYDDTKQVFIVRNSWGSGWGDKGYFYMPYAYITNPNLASDFWSIRSN